MVRGCILVVLLLYTVTVSIQTRLSESKSTYASSKYLWDKIKFGKRWQVYIHVMTYDLMHSSFYRQGLSKYGTPKNFLGVIGNLTTVAWNKHVCRKGAEIMRGRQIYGKFYVQNSTQFSHFMAAEFRICGVFIFTYYPSHYIDESNVVPDVLKNTFLMIPDVVSHKHTVVNLKAGEGFRINCTLSEFTAPRSHGCADGRVEVELFQTQKNIRYFICPNWGKQNFVAINIKVSLYILYYQKALSMHIGDQYFTNISLHYQILDFASMLLYSSIMVPHRQSVEAGMKYMLEMYRFYNDTLLINDISSLIYVGKFHSASIYSFTLYTDDFLTPVISRANVTCNIPEGETIFYDGPAQTVWQPALPLLKHWSCLNISDGTTGGSDQDEVRGSVGELNIILFAPRVKTRVSVFLTIAWHAERILPDILQFRKIFVDFGTERTIHFKSTRSTSVELVHIQAPNDTFVHLGVLEISHVLHSQMHSSRFFESCLDGFEIKDPMRFHVLGHICSNSTAQNLLNHYQTDGLTVGQRVIIRKKQYAWLATTSAVISASARRCAGYINVLPRMDNIFSINKLPGVVVSFYAAKKYFANGSFHGYLDLLIIFKRSLKACIKLQIVPFEELGYYEMHLSIHVTLAHAFLKYSISSQDLTSTARFITDFSSMGNTVQFGNTSSLYGLRIYSLNHRSGKHTIPYTGVWDTEAYSAEIALHSSVLPHAAGFKLQVEDGKTLPVCTYEDGTNGTYLVFYNVNLLGPCAYADFTSKEVYSVVIGKIYENIHCCHFEGYITTDHSIEGTILLHLSLPVRYEPWIANSWDLPNNNNIIKFQVLCAHLCESVAIALKLGGISSSPFTVAYHANIIEKTFPVAISFPHLRLPFSPATRQSRLVTWNQICHRMRCYMTPRSYVLVTWDEAQKACEEQQANLVTINSDLEWALLTRLPREEGKDFIQLYNISGFIIFYIGLVASVSI